MPESHRAHTLTVRLTREEIDARRDRVRALTLAGMSAADIAEAERITKRTVARIRRRVGVAHPPPPPSLTAQEVAAAQAMLADGCSYAEVARTLRRGETTLRRALPGYGWTREECGQFTAMVRRLSA